MTFDINISINDEVFHKKFGNGKVINTDSETAEVEFRKFGTRKVFIKFLFPRH